MGPVVKDLGMFVYILRKNKNCWGFEWISGLIVIAQDFKESGKGFVQKVNI